MNMKNWHGLMKVLEIKHWAKDGELLWQDKNLLNTFHTEGEEFTLQVLFGGEAIPTAYFIGLDDRDDITTADTLVTASGSEPVGNGYLRNPVLSDGEFTFTITDAGFTQAQTPVVTFTASGGIIGPVRNMFLATTEDTTGALLSTVRLSSAVQLDDGERVTVRLGLAMRDCTSGP